MLLIATLFKAEFGDHHETIIAPKGTMEGDVAEFGDAKMAIRKHDVIFAAPSPTGPFPKLGNDYDAPAFMAGPYDEAVINLDEVLKHLGLEKAMEYVVRDEGVFDTHPGRFTDGIYREKITINDKTVIAFQQASGGGQSSTDYPKPWAALKFASEFNGKTLSGQEAEKFFTDFAEKLVEVNEFRLT